MSETSFQPAANQPAKSSAAESRKKRSLFANPAMVLMVGTVFVLAAIINWNDQRKVANLGNDVAGFESALQDYVTIALERGVTCFDYAYENKFRGLTIGPLDLENETAENRAAVDRAASQLKAAVELLSPANRTLAVNRINTVLDEANNKLSSRLRAEKPGVFTMPFEDRRRYLVDQAQENGADLKTRIGSNAPWGTRSLAAFIFAVGWRSALAALVADAILGIIFSGLFHSWDFLLNRIRELGRAARGL